MWDRYCNIVEEKGFNQALKITRSYVVRRLINTLRPIGSTLYQPLSIHLHSRLSNHWNVFNEDWDLLIILDGCRYDALKSAGEEYSFLSEIDARWSVGAQSIEWMINTFTEEYRNEISKTAYISSNPHVITVFENKLKQDPRSDRQIPLAEHRLDRYSVSSWVDSDAFYKYLPLFEDSTDYGSRTFPSPRSITNHVINIDRGDDPPPRIIAHYMPPHNPYISRVVNGEIEFTDEPRNSSFEAYLDNLRWGLEEVSLLLENVDRDKVVITADHGWAFSGRPIRNSHPPGGFLPDIRRVPWAETTAVDNRTYEPESPEENEQESPPRNEMLEALGYLT